MSRTRLQQQLKLNLLGLIPALIAAFVIKAQIQL